MKGAENEIYIGKAKAAGAVLSHMHNDNHSVGAYGKQHSYMSC